MNERSPSAHPVTPQVARSLLSERGVRPTPHREEIYLALRACATHPTAEELFNTVRKEHPGISLATVYNTLDVLTRSGLCRKLASGHSAACPPAPGPTGRAKSNSPSSGGGVRYDADLHDHVHLVTTQGRICDLPPELGRELLAHLSPALLRKVEAATGCKVGRVNLEIFEATQPSSSSLSAS